jgi:hypothetical protein
MFGKCFVQVRILYVLYSFVTYLLTLPRIILRVSYMLQPPAHGGSLLADFYILKLETIRSSETSVYTISTRRHIPEDGILHSHSRENLKSYLPENIQSYFEIHFIILLIRIRVYSKHGCYIDVQISLLL